MNQEQSLLASTPDQITEECSVPSSRFSTNAPPEITTLGAETLSQEGSGAEAPCGRPSFVDRSSTRGSTIRRSLRSRVPARRAVRESLRWMRRAVNFRFGGTSRRTPSRSRPPAREPVLDATVNVPPLRVRAFDKYLSATRSERGVCKTRVISAATTRTSARRLQRINRLNRLIAPLSRAHGHRRERLYHFNSTRASEAPVITTRPTLGVCSLPGAGAWIRSAFPERFWRP